MRRSRDVRRVGGEAVELEEMKRQPLATRQQLSGDPHQRDRAGRRAESVFNVGADPVQGGLVPSISRPDGNATGVYYVTTALGEKRLGLLRELLPGPGAAPIAMLVNPNSPAAALTSKEVQIAAAAVGQRVEVFHATNNGEIDIAFERIVSMQAGRFLLSPDPLFTNRRVQIVRWRCATRCQQCIRRENM